MLDQKAIINLKELPRGAKEIIQYKESRYYECEGVLYKKIRKNTSVFYQVISFL